MLQEIQRSDLQVHSVLIVRHGYVVTEVYFPPYTRELKHPVYSITKSVTSAMTGIAVNDGLITGVQEPVLDYFPDVAKTAQDDYLPDVSIEHPDDVRRFQYHGPARPQEQGCELRCRPLRLTNNRVLDKPGRSFFYDSGLAHVLSTILQQTSGVTLEECARRELFGRWASRIHLGSDRKA
jgi:CubicO group peptidase (beta-lactamase class C family)